MSNLRFTAFVRVKAGGDLGRRAASVLTSSHPILRDGTGRRRGKLIHRRSSWEAECDLVPNGGYTYLPGVTLPPHVELYVAPGRKTMQNNDDFELEVYGEPSPSAGGDEVTGEKRFLLLLEFDRGDLKVGITSRSTKRHLEYADRINDKINRVLIWDYGDFARASAIEQLLLRVFDHRRVLKPSTGTKTEYLRDVIGGFNTVKPLLNELAIYHRARLLDPSELVDEEDEL